MESLRVLCIPLLFFPESQRNVSILPPVIYIVWFSQQVGKVMWLSFYRVCIPLELVVYQHVSNGNFQYFQFRFHLTFEEFPPALLGNSWIKPLIKYDRPRKSLLICHSIRINYYATFQFVYGFIKQDAIPWFPVTLFSGFPWFNLSAKYFVLYFSRRKMAGWTFSLFLFFTTWFSELQIPGPLVSYMYVARCCRGLGHTLRNHVI